MSNIAWGREVDGEVAGLMRAAGVRGIEIAPTAVWADPLAASDSAVRGLRQWWQDREIAVVALQALLYGRPDLTLFESEARRRATLEHLTGMMDLASALGARPMVFGSPKNRAVGALPPDESRRIAVDFFRDAGARAAERGVVLCVEPNPAAYGCDFVNTTAEGLALVRAVGSPGFGLHLDAGALTLNHEPVAAAIAGAAVELRHFHASEPSLAPLGTAGSDHAACAMALRRNGYDGWVSVEMRPAADGRAGLERVLGLLREYYGA